MKWGVILGALVVAIAFAIWRSRDTEEAFKKNVPDGAKTDVNETNFENRSVSTNPIDKILNDLKVDFLLFNKIKVKGWSKHNAVIDHLLITRQGITVFRNIEIPAKSVTATQSEWILDTKEGRKKIKNPVNMNNYAISILRNILKKSAKSIYHKLDFVSVVLFDDSVKINSSLKENKNAIVIKKSLLHDLLETITQKPAKLSKEEVISIGEILK